jgi:hypothetical protein
MGTVNLHEANYLMEPDQILVKDSEGEGMMDALQTAGIARDTGETVRIGLYYAKNARLLV